VVLTIQKAKKWNNRYYAMVALSNGNVVELKSSVSLDELQWQELARKVETSLEQVEIISDGDLFTNEEIREQVRNRKIKPSYLFSKEELNITVGNLGIK